MHFRALMGVLFLPHHNQNIINNLVTSEIRNTYIPN